MAAAKAANRVVEVMGEWACSVADTVVEEIEDLEETGERRFEAALGHAGRPLVGRAAPRSVGPSGAVRWQQIDFFWYFWAKYFAIEYFRCEMNHSIKLAFVPKILKPCLL